MSLEQYEQSQAIKHNLMAIYLTFTLLVEIIINSTIGAISRTLPISDNWSRAHTGSIRPGGSEQVNYKLTVTSTRIFFLTHNGVLLKMNRRSKNWIKEKILTYLPQK